MPNMLNRPLSIVRLNSPSPFEKLGPSSSYAGGGSPNHRRMNVLERWHRNLWMACEDIPLGADAALRTRIWTPEEVRAENVRLGYA